MVANRAIRHHSNLAIHLNPDTHHRHRAIQVAIHHPEDIHNPADIHNQAVILHPVVFRNQVLFRRTCHHRKEWTKDTIQKIPK